MPSCLGCRPIPDCMLRSHKSSSHAVKLAPAPLSIDPSPHTFDCLRRRSSRLRERAVLMAAAAAMPPPARPPSSSSLLLLWLLIARHWQLDTLDAAALRRWANRLHVGDPRHIVMLPSGAMARLLTFDDHWHRGLFLLLWEAACGSYGHVVTRETLVALVISLPMIEVGFCGADGQLAAACIACIASARKKRSRVSQMSISGSSFCKGLRIHRSECC